MAKGKMCDREVSFLSQTLERAEEEFLSSFMGYCSLEDSAAALGANRTELSSQDIISVSLPAPLLGPLPCLC